MKCIYTLRDIIFGKPRGGGGLHCTWKSFINKPQKRKKRLNAFHLVGDEGRPRGESVVMDKNFVH